MLWAEILKHRDRPTDLPLPIAQWRGKDAAEMLDSGGFNDPAESLPSSVRSSHIPNDGDSNKGVRRARDP